MMLEVLYNIVRLEGLRRQFLRPDLLRLLKNFKYAKLIFVRYVAVAIIAHLACEGENKRLVEEMEPHMLDDMKEVVLSWEQPEERIFDSRSFKYFCPLLNCIDTPAVQLWALFSIQHIYIQRRGLHCGMREEGVTTLLYKLAEDSQTDADVVKMIKDILYMVEQTAVERKHACTTCMENVE